MSALPQTRLQQKQRTRIKLVDAAAAVFRREGYQGARLRQISAEAGVSTGALFNHFEGKDDIYKATLGEIPTDPVAFLRRFGGELPAPLARLAAEIVEEPHHD